ncbi:MAG: FAD-binding protein [Solirubrobacteraceae bacterium]|nr:FAD-binding protein [Solirubrobacteraceae bacterium]
MGLTDTTFTTWAGDERCRPARIVRARTVDDVRDAVRAAARDGLTVKAVGSGHSFTPAAMTDGVLVDIAALDRVLDVDREAGLVRVEAGITIHALADALAGHGLAFENLGDIDRQTIAGATATGTHGTGGALRNISSQIVAVDLVDGHGDLVRLDATTDPDGLRAARVSVGALGIVVAVTLRCVPAYVLRGVDTTAPLDEVLDAVDERVAAHRHFELYAFPHARRALTRTNDVVDEPATPPGRVARFLRQGLLETYALRGLSAAGRAVPPAIPTLNRTVVRLAGTTVRTDRSDRIFASPRHVRFMEMEYALPRAATVPAVREILATIDRHGYAVNFPIEVRFVAGDDALLSPAHGRDTGYVAVHAYHGMEWRPYFRAVEAIADAHGGRPHWGKRHFQTAGSLAGRYPEWDRFQAVRSRLDPEGRFANAYTTQTLGPVRDTARVGIAGAAGSA